MDNSHKNQYKQVFCGKESSSNRSVTLQNLLSAGILESGPGAMTIEYLVRYKLYTVFLFLRKINFKLAVQPSYIINQFFFQDVSIYFKKCPKTVKCLNKNAPLINKEALFLFLFK